MANSNSDKARSLKVTQYTFGSLDKVSSSSPSEGVAEFELKELSGYREIIEEKQRPEIIQEKNLAHADMFKISPIVKKHRGIQAVEEQEFKDEVEAEVKRRLESISQAAYEKGQEQGRLEGLEKITKARSVGVKENIERLRVFIDTAQQGYSTILQNQVDEVYELIKTLTKWVILRELKDDGAYLQRVLEKLIHELKTRSNILIQVNEHNFKEIPDILSQMNEKLGEFKNIRVEKIADENEPGVILESDNGILVGTLEAQFKAIDKIIDDNKANDLIEDVNEDLRGIENSEEGESES